MSRETEKIFKDLEKFLKEKNPQTMEEREALVDQFIEQRNANLFDYEDELTESNAETSDDYLELAYQAASEKTALKYAKTALELDPDNLDAEALAAQISSNSMNSLLEKYKKMLDKAQKKLEDDGFFSDDYIGSFWRVLETRPYMRVRCNYIETLISCGMMSLARAECEEMLRLCTNDNLGIRYKLMTIYAHFEDEKSAAELFERYGKDMSAHMLLPLSMLYYKLNDLKTASKYLKSIYMHNNDLNEFIECMLSGEIASYLAETNQYAYRPDTMEELLDVAMINQCFFIENMEYYIWAHTKLKRMKK